MKPLWFNILEPDSPPIPWTPPQKAKRGRGCHGCPLDEEEGVNKILGLDRIEGRSAMLWAQAPGESENEEGRELTGKAAQWLWKEFRRIGLTRDQFDIQNVVRCRPTSHSNGRLVDREPTPDEVHHCGHHTEHALALNAGKAEVHIVLGKIAASALLGSEYKKDRPVFWSQRLSALVVCLDHPNYFLRGAPKWRLEEFRLRLEAAAWFMRHPGRFAFVESLDCRSLTKPEGVRSFLQRAKASKQRVAVDIEEGLVDGQARVLCVGISYQKRSARVIYLDHPENPRTKAQKAEVLELLKEFLEDPSIKKVLQWGCYDVDRLRELVGIRVRGYDFDTTFAHYLRYTFLKSHGLETIASLHYPLYAGYKDLIKKFVKNSGNFADIPMDRMTVYNGADACLTKEIELDLEPQISLPLLKIYTQCGITLHRMEKRGPILDKIYFKELYRIIPLRLKKLEAKLRSLADEPNLNLNTPAEVAKVLYDKLGLPDMSEGKRSTKENFLDLLIQETDHPFPKGVLEYRKLQKILTTYLRGYKTSADMNGGELRTKWYLAGAVTGRLRSGGSKEGIKGVINMQNLHGDPVLQNLLVSDANWRDALEYSAAILKAAAAGKPVPSIPDEVQDLYVFLALDYSQIEIRMLAECSGDPVLIQQFRSGQDIHCAVGSTLNPAWSFEFIKKDKPTRTFVKNCHFGMVYGLDERGLFYYLKAKGVKTTERKVAKFHRAYFRKYRGVADFIETTRAFVQEHGFVETMFGFRRMIGSDADEDRTTNPENQAINSPIQGSAHTLLLAAMALLSARPKTYNLLQRPLMEVHDALVFKVRLRDLAAAYAMAKKLLEKDAPSYIRKLYGIKLQVPLLAEASAGFRYGTMVELEEMTPKNLLPAWYKKHLDVEAAVDRDHRQEPV